MLALVAGSHVFDAYPPHSSASRMISRWRAMPGHALSKSATSRFIT